MAHAFIERIPGVPVVGDRAEMLRKLWVHHREVIRQLGFRESDLYLAEQVHGCGVAVIDEDTREGSRRAGADALITSRRGKLLGIYVADCCAVFLVDPISPAIGLVHSGKKGTERGVVPAALAAMQATFGTRPADVIAQLSPCVRPPDYEIDFAAAIRRQCADAGVPDGQICDDGISTASNLSRFYSYRAEKGRTGRMLALLGLLHRTEP
jgi:copper oxidase (laccase) domain-containing protein